jgi:CBS domain-containing protein
MHAIDIMTNAVITVGPNKPLKDIAKLLINRRISAVPVIDKERRLLGIVSEGDLVHRVLGDHASHSWWLSLIGDPDDVPREYVRSHGKTAKDVMTKQVITSGLFASIAELAELLESNNIKRVPIVDAGKLAGIVSRANIIQALVAMEDDHLPKSARSDQKIRAALMKEFEDRAWAHKAGLNVIVNKGVVRYWGYVGSEDARDALRVAAENVPGVKSVEDNLGVSTMPVGYI